MPLLWKAWKSPLLPVWVTFSRLVRVLVKVCGWAGAGALMVAPFIIDTSEGKLLACTGLALLTVQALKIRAYNLVLLNLVGVAGYIYSL
jgi:hypothetical protein